MPGTAGHKPGRHMNTRFSAVEPTYTCLIGIFTVRGLGPNKHGVKPLGEVWLEKCEPRGIPIMLIRGTKRGSTMKKAIKFAGMLLALGLASTAYSAGFVNGGFEAGNTSGWTVGNGNRGGQNFSAIDPAAYLNGNTGRSAILTSGLDPLLGSLMPNVVYSGNNSYRVEDTGTGGLLSVISQTVTNYTDPNIFFAWMAVLDNGGHSAQQSAGMIITLRDLTVGDILIDRRYNAGAGGVGVDSRFTAGAGGLFYTSQWQIEQLTIDATRAGNTFQLTVLATDCGPTAHTGYVYLDGFGAVRPDDPNGRTPEPGTMGLLAAAMLGAVVAVRRKRS